MPLPHSDRVLACGFPALSASCCATSVCDSVVNVVVSQEAHSRHSQASKNVTVAIDKIEAHSRHRQASKKVPVSLDNAQRTHLDTEPLYTRANIGKAFWEGYGLHFRAV